MSKAKIFYFTLRDEQTKEEKLDWFERTQFEHIPFDHIAPDQKANWINLTDNDFDSLLPLIDKEVKAGKSQEAVFQLFSSGIKTQRDEWVYSFSKEPLVERMKYFIEVYRDRLKNGLPRDLDIKWDDDLSRFLERKIVKNFEIECIKVSQYRPYNKRFIYFDKHFNARTYQWLDLIRSESQNVSIAINVGNPDFACLASDLIFDLATLKSGNGITQCLPLYRYNANGNRIDNITDWGLTQFQNHYNDVSITKQDIFHYTYAVLHHPVYRTKYDRNLKRDFPRLPFYINFHQWATWGKALMALHLHYETVAPYGLKRIDLVTDRDGKANQPNSNQPTLFAPDPSSLDASTTVKPIKHTTQKPKLKADKIEGKIILDRETILEGVPAVAWDYKLGNRSALEWILDQYKEKTPKDPTIAKLFNTYRFADYKEQVIDLLQRVCTVSVQTMAVIQQMPAE